MKSTYARGLLLLASSSVIFALMSVLARFATSISPFIITSSRFTVGITVIAGLTLLRAIELKAVNWKWLLLRGFFGAFGVYLFYFGIQKLGLGKGTVLNYTYPVFAALIAPALLKDRLNLDVLAAVGAAFLGIYLVVSPGGLFAVSRDALLALCGGAAAGVAIVAVKRLRDTDSPYIIYLS